MQPASSSIWTRVAVSISYDDNHYTTGTSKVDDTQQNVFKIISYFASHPILYEFYLCLYKDHDPTQGIWKYFKT